MITAEVIDALVAAGCTAEQLAAAVKASIGSRTAAAERQARYRARKKEREDESRNESVTRDVTLRNERNAVTVGFSLSPVPPSSPPHPPNNPLTPKPSSKNKQDRAHRLPENHTMSGPDLAYALSKGLSEAETADLFERFCSWAWSASGPNARKVNWHQAWQGWVQRDGPKIIATRRGKPPGRPLTEFQHRQNETRDILDDLDMFASSRSGSSPQNPGLLPNNPGQRPQGLRGGAGAAVIDLPDGGYRASG